MRGRVRQAASGGRRERGTGDRLTGIERLEQRHLLACTGLAGTSVACYSSDGAGAPQSSWLTPVAPLHSIEGYTSEASVAPGESVEFHVSSDQGYNYRIEIYRLGWYDGDGGRRVADLPATAGSSFVGFNQGIPAPDPVTLEVRANWSVTQSFVVPYDWHSGYYLANLILTSGPNAGEAHHVPFIVRAEASRHSDILVEVPVNTWQAYNSWGGHSLYDPAAADKVSFDRPYADITHILRYEVNLLRYLEREGFDVQYATNVDVHRDPASLQDHQLVIASGHDEYWTSEMRTAFEAARDAGTNLVFMGSNMAYWQVRFENAEQTLVGYKVKPPTANEDPEPDLSKKSMQFRQLTPARPECELIGVQYMDTFTTDFDPDESLYPDYTVATASLSHPWFNGSEILTGATFANRVGYEWDQLVPGCRNDQMTFFEYNAGALSAHATAYTAASGATVFAAGSMGMNYALDDWRQFGPPVSPADERLQTFFHNMFTDLSNAATTDITIFAAGDTGEEQMQLWVDGQVAQTWDNIDGDFNQRQFQTFQYKHFGDLTIDQIRIVFSNDGSTALGADKNLNVDAIVVNGVTYQSEDPSTFSVGTWNNADGCAPGNKQSETIHCSGYFDYSLPDGGTVIEIFAAGETGEEEMQLLIDNAVVKTWRHVGGDADNRAFERHTYTHPSQVTLDQLRIEFSNDANTSTGRDRNLIVDAITFNGQRYETEAPTTYSTATWDNATGCAPGNKQSEALHCGGYFQYAQSATGSVVEILAAGHTGEEQMQIEIDGFAVRTWNNIGGDPNSRQFVSYTYTHPSPLTIDQIRVAFSNDGNTATGADKNLTVDAILLDGLRYESESPDTYSVGIYTNDTGCGPGYKQGETIYCDGFLQYNSPQAATNLQARAVSLRRLDGDATDQAVAAMFGEPTTLSTSTRPESPKRKLQQSSAIDSEAAFGLQSTRARLRARAIRNERATEDVQPDSLVETTRAFTAFRQRS
ncbi:MAG: DUF6605 domain-containing protein [Pirellulaceae bacterium]